MIDYQQLIEKFRYALDNAWGYIWGTTGILWTQAKQDQKVAYMVSKYGANWKTSEDAKKDTYYYAAKDGAKWIGHYVADCSGLFVWAFKQLGGAIAHGSNSIYDRYCSSKGNLSGGKRTDGKTLQPGSAVFTNKNGDKTHIGLYVGNGKVIEAASTGKGVVESNVTDSKWKCWGELKEVSYDTEPTPAPIPDDGTAVVVGGRLNMRQGPDKSCKIVTQIPNGKTVNLIDLPKGWSYVEYNGKQGFVMNEYLKGD